MHTILDYMKWRGDLTFEERHFNAVDCLICSIISYFPFEKAVKDPDVVLTLEQLYHKMIENNVREKDFLMFNDVELLKQLVKSKRYQELKLTRFVSVTNLDKEKQFAAVTILLPNHYVYVSYRGTDDSFVGWKEDFNMTYLDVVPAQQSAVQYLNELKAKFMTKILVGGHSKGGNLAIYAALHCQNKIKSRIKHIFNYDGPGFLKDITKSPEYQRIAPMISTYVPQTSIIGRLLNCNEEYKVVKSNQKLVWQHDYFSWEVDVDDFVYDDEVDPTSNLLDNIISEWLGTVTLEEREQFIDIIYRSLLTTNASNFKELDLKGIKGIKQVLKMLEHLNKEDKKVVNKVAWMFFKALKQHIF